MGHPDLRTASSKPTGLTCWTFCPSTVRGVSSTWYAKPKLLIPMASVGRVAKFTTTRQLRTPSPRLVTARDSRHEERPWVRQGRSSSSPADKELGQLTKLCSHIPMPLPALGLSLGGCLERSNEVLVGAVTERGFEQRIGRS